VGDGERREAGLLPDHGLGGVEAASHLVGLGPVAAVEPALVPREEAEGRFRRGRGAGRGRGRERPEEGSEATGVAGHASSASSSSSTTTTAAAAAACSGACRGAGASVPVKRPNALVDLGCAHARRLAFFDVRSPSLWLW